jgi:AraC-like DNA-binding protein
MKLFIKNMVCNRCNLAVQQLLERKGLQPLQVTLGEVLLAEETLPAEVLENLGEALKALGFELLDDKRKKLIEQVKTLIIELVHYKEEQPTLKYSELIAEKLHHDYSYLSKLFSEVTGTTIEQFTILQKIERVKELLVYDESNLNEIAFQMGYSSAAHLSAQFKKVTGLTPSHFKKSGGLQRKPLDQV